MDKTEGCDMKEGYYVVVRTEGGAERVERLEKVNNVRNPWRWYPCGGYYCKEPPLKIVRRLRLMNAIGWQ